MTKATMPEGKSNSVDYGSLSRDGSKATSASIVSGAATAAAAAAAAAASSTSPAVQQRLSKDTNSSIASNNNNSTSGATTSQQEPISRPKSTPASIDESVTGQKDANKSEMALESKVSLAAESSTSKTTPQLPSSSSSKLQSQNQTPRSLISSKPCTVERPKNVAVREPEQLNPTSVEYPEDKNSEIMLFLVPNRLPEPPQSRNPLAEMYYTTQQMPLSKLLPASSKTLSTSTYQLALLEGKLAVVHARIEELKRSSKWSLRQHVKFKAPLRPKTHWDHLLDEMRWMQMDFKEERKLKIAVCWEIANAVKDYWKLGKDACCIKTRRPIELLPEEDRDESDRDKRLSGDEEQSNMADRIGEEENKQLADAVERAKVDSAGDTEMKEIDDTSTEKQVVDSENHIDKGDSDTVSMKQVETSTSEIDHQIKKFSTAKDYDTIVPTKVNSDDVGVTPFKCYAAFDAMNTASNQIFDMLPEVNAFTPNAPYINEFDSLSLTSVTKFLSAPDLGRGWQRLVVDIDDSKKPIPPSDPEGPLFGKDSHRRSNVVRAPQPPHLKYIENRTPSMWLPHDDNKLVRLAKDYQYNWTIVAMHLLPESTKGYVSSIERRTPWQCFERWYQLNPNFNLSDLRGPYASAAHKWMDAAAKAQAQSKRRMYPMGVVGESVQRGHRRLRWASMFDAVRKSMKKRENAPRPNNSVQRKSQMDNASRNNVPSPADLSRMKFERDRTIAEQYANSNGFLNRPQQGQQGGQQSAQRASSATPQSSSSSFPNNGTRPGSATGASTGNQSSGMAQSQPQGQSQSQTPQAAQAAQIRAAQQLQQQQQQQVQQRQPGNNGTTSGDINSPSAATAGNSAGTGTSQNMQYATPQARTADQLQQLLQQRQMAVNRQGASQAGQTNAQQVQQQPGTPQLQQAQVQALAQGQQQRRPGGVQAQQVRTPQQNMAAIIRANFTPQQIQQLIDRFRQQQPSLSEDDAKKLAYQHIQRLIQQRQMQQQLQNQQQSQQSQQQQQQHQSSASPPPSSSQSPPQM